MKKGKKDENSDETANEQKDEDVNEQKNVHSLFYLNKTLNKISFFFFIYISMYTQ